MGNLKRRRATREPSGFAEPRERLRPRVENPGPQEPKLRKPAQAGKKSSKIFLSGIFPEVEAAVTADSYSMYWDFEPFFPDCGDIPCPGLGLAGPLSNPIDPIEPQPTPTNPDQAPDDVDLPVRARVLLALQWAGSGTQKGNNDETE